MWNGCETDVKRMGNGRETDGKRVRNGCETGGKRVWNGVTRSETDVKLTWYDWKGNRISNELQIPETGGETVVGDTEFEGMWHEWETHVKRTWNGWECMPVKRRGWNGLNGFWTDFKLLRNVRNRVWNERETWTAIKPLVHRPEEVRSVLDPLHVLFNQCPCTSVSKTFRLRFKAIYRAVSTPVHFRSASVLQSVSKPFHMRSETASVIAAYPFLDHLPPDSKTASRPLHAWWKPLQQRFKTLHVRVIIENSWYFVRGSSCWTLACRYQMNYQRGWSARSSRRSAPTFDITKRCHHCASPRAVYAYWAEEFILPKYCDIFLHKVDNPHKNTLVNVAMMSADTQILSWRSHMKCWTDIRDRAFGAR